MYYGSNKEDVLAIQFCVAIVKSSIEGLEIVDKIEFSWDSD